MEDLRNEGERLWLNVHGDKLRWADMNVRYLRNAAAMLLRRLEHELACARATYAYVSGEMAEYEIESAIKQIENPEHELRILAADMQAYADWREMQ